MALSQGFRLLLFGLSGGLVLSWAVTRLLRSQLFGVSATDAPTYLIVAIILCLIALLAAYLPARRAARINPMRALRHE
jgi:putative ABC transport system permease protein